MTSLMNLKSKEMNILEIWKGPYKNIQDIYIFSSEDVMVCSLLLEDHNFNEAIVAKLNNKEVDPFIGNFESNGEYICYNGNRVMMMGGWRHLTGVGALNLPQGTAIKLQDEMRDWIVETLNKE